LQESSKRRIDSSLIILLISDGNSKDHWEDITKTAHLIFTQRNVQVLALTVSEKYSKDELKAWTMNDSNIFTARNQAAWLNRVKGDLATCTQGSIERLPTTFRPTP
ncbi:hypothetical protein PFISCL1PPCAC_20553, partial [Pristionchus fissidentatus]